MSAIPGPSGLQTSHVLCETVPTTYSDEDSDNREDDDDEVIEPESEIEDLDYEANPPQWSSFNRIGMKPVKFTKEEGFLVPLPEEKSPISFFRLLVDIIFLEGIVKATNKYALELFCGPSTVPGSKISKWKDLSVDELWIFIGLLLHMGIIQMPRLQDYWKQSKLFISVFPKVETGS
uniref:PiggyBac transposable element-derived protein domain-containing protein n=1 Tax=Clastoptera arizonana TaxID=38151 RepID=A0A1B6DSJ1_9HEMI